MSNRPGAPKNPMGKNNFDKLADASLLGPKMADPEQVKAKLETRISRLNELKAGLAEVNKTVAELYLVPQKKQLQRLTTAMNMTTKLMVVAKGMQGVRTPLNKCMNELTSLREGVYTNSASDKKTLAIMSAREAIEEIDTLTAASKQRLETVEAAFDVQKYFDQAEKVIQNNQHEVSKVQPLANRPFMIARVPVIPADGHASAEKLNSLGFKAEDLSGYPLIHNQLVLGINPKKLAQVDTSKMDDEAAKLHREKQAKKSMSAQITAEVQYLKKLIEKEMKTKLQLVSPQAYRFGGGSWYWLMTEKQLDAFAKAFPGKAVKVLNWGFGFNEEAK